MHSSNIWSIDLPNTNFYLEINRRAIRTIGATYMQYFAKTLLSYTCTACIFFFINYQKSQSKIYRYN